MGWRTGNWAVRREGRPETRELDRGWVGWGCRLRSREMLACKKGEGGDGGAEGEARPTCEGHWLRSRVGLPGGRGRGAGLAGGGGGARERGLQGRGLRRLGT